MQIVVAAALAIGQGAISAKRISINGGAMHAWYVAATHHRCELLAEQQLRRDKLQPFNPKCAVTKIVRGVEVTTRRPYIPGYIFINFDRDAEAWRFINATHGIKRLLGNNPERPEPVNPKAMQLIFDRCGGGDLVIDQDALDKALEKFIPIGAEVKVKVGPFASFTGPVQRLEKNREYIVLCSIFGRSTEVRVPDGGLELVR